MDPFEVLGLAPGATVEEVRAARRRLAKELHPDRHPDDPLAASHMRDVNHAASIAAEIARTGAPVASAARQPSETTADAPENATGGGPRRVRVMATDLSSFVVECPRAEAFERLYIVAHWIGEPIEADPPAVLELRLDEPTECWCRLDLVPEAGASMVSVTVGAIEGAPWPPPSTDAVRDLLVDQLNRLRSPI